MMHYPYPTRIDAGHRVIAKQGGSENQYRYAYYVCILENGTRHRFRSRPGTVAIVILENGTRHRICLFVK